LITDTGVFTLANGAQINGALGSTTDVDVYRVVLTAPLTGIWMQVTEGDAPWTSQHRYEILDAAGALLTPTTTLGANAGDSGSFSFRTSQIRCWPAGTYHLVVRNRLGIAPYQPVALGNYRLEFIAMQLLTGATVNEVEPNNNFATATPIQPGDEGRGSVTAFGGTDGSDYWGPIVVSTPSVYMFQTAQWIGGTTGTAILDTTINLRQLDTCSAFPTPVIGPPTPVLSGNTLSPTGHARGTFSFFLTPATYYLEVASPGTSAPQVGDYLLQISSIQPAPYVTASYVITAANPSCGVAPIPTLTRAFTNEVPTIGQPFVRAITGLTPFGVGIFIQDFAPVCPPNATPGPLAESGDCWLNVAPTFLAAGIADAAGVFESELLLPCTTALTGVTLFEQAAELSLTTFLVQYGNYARAIVGDRSY
jgi:hypothetical protein